MASSRFKIGEQMFKAQWFEGSGENIHILEETDLTEAVSSDQALSIAKGMFGEMWERHKPRLKGFRIQDDKTGRIVRAFDADL